MMQDRTIIILDIDKKMALERIAELESAIQKLGPEFHDVFNQSSETWHDNAPFEAVRDRQSVMAAELQNLKATLRNSSAPTSHQNKEQIGIGATVIVTELGTKQRSSYYIAGDWTYRTGQKYGDGEALIVSSQAPLAKNMLGLGVGDAFDSRSKQYRIDLIEWS